MKYRYKKFGPEVLRPVIPVELEHNGMVLRYEALVDSGADMCIFPGEIGELLGIDVERGIAQSVTGVTGVLQSYYIHPVSIRIGEVSVDVDVGFLPHMTDFGYGVLGQHGFFDLFKVKFDLQKEEIELEKYS